MSLKPMAQVWTRMEASDVYHALLEAKRLQLVMCAAIAIFLVIFCAIAQLNAQNHLLLSISAANVSSQGIGCKNAPTSVWMYHGSHRVGMCVTSVINLDIGSMIVLEIGPKRCQRDNRLVEDIHHRSRHRSNGSQQHHLKGTIAIFVVVQIIISPTVHAAALPVTVLLAHQPAVLVRSVRVWPLQEHLSENLLIGAPKAH